MIKTYFSLNAGYLSTSVSTPAGRTFITFRQHRFTTADPVLQQAIENDSGYGREFTEAPEPPAPAPVPEPAILTPVETVRNKQQALEYLRLHCGEELRPATTLARIRTVAQQHGIEFINL